MDLGQIVGSVKRAAAADLRAGGERVAVAVRLLTPLLQNPALSQGGNAQLAADLRAAVANRNELVLLLPPGQLNESTPARVEVGARQFAIPTALRDALLAALADEARGGAPAQAAATPAPAANTADTALRAWVINVETQAATQQGAGAGAGAGAGGSTARPAEAARPPLPAVPFETPIVESTLTAESSVAADRLRAHVDRSGLFYEAHVAQWAQGDRRLDEIRNEALRLLERTGGNAIAGTDAASQRMADQVDVLQRQGFTLQGAAWAGQPMTLEVERDIAQRDDGSAAEDDRHPIFAARLRLELPQLGVLEVRLRLAGDAVATRVAASDLSRVEPELGQLAEQLRARGLAPVLTQAVPLEAP